MSDENQEAPQKSAQIEDINLVCKLINEADPDANINCEEISKRFESGEINYNDAIKQMENAMQEAMKEPVTEEEFKTQESEAVVEGASDEDL